MKTKQEREADVQRVRELSNEEMFNEVIDLFLRARAQIVRPYRERDENYKRALNAAWIILAIMPNIDPAERFSVCQHCACPAEFHRFAKEGEPKCPVCGAKYDGPRRAAHAVLLHAGISPSEGEWP